MSLICIICMAVHKFITYCYYYKISTLDNNKTQPWGSYIVGFDEVLYQKAVFVT